MKKSAKLSACKKYRYTLSRQWDENLPTLICVGLNPSTADHKVDDPTIKRCIQYAQSWNYGSLLMLNLFAYRATEPKTLLLVDDPIGKRNNYYLKKNLDPTTKVLLMWGNWGSIQNRNKQVLKMIENPFCLHVNKSGEPAHPLYLKKDLQLQVYKKSLYDLPITKA